MFHDALSQWNQKEAQLHIKTRYPGFENRFIKPVGTTCAGTIYKDKPPGNSPEDAKGLDSFGFGVAPPLRRPPSDLRPGDAQGGVVPYGADFGCRGRALERAHHGGHLGVGAGVRQDHRGQGLHSRTSGPAAARGRCMERGGA